MEVLESQQNRAVTAGGFRGAVSEILGQFVTRAFWKDLTKTLVQEAFATFLMTLGGVLVFYGKQRRSEKVAPMMDAAAAGASTGTAARAFGNGFTPSTNYQPSTAFPVPPNPSGDGRFPGFGGGR